ncbi:MAG: DUF4870 domain-containing protein [Bacteroidetes bacterium]|nr:MAG: DUF4870 domain-containing protein [Bacteroidota bacterium]
MADEVTTTAQGFDPQDIEQNKTMAILAYIIWLVPLIAANQSKFARYHTNQALILSICIVAFWIVMAIITAILPWGFFLTIGIVFSLLWIAVWIFALVCIIMGIITASKGEAKPLPVIGNLFTILK